MTTTEAREVAGKHQDIKTNTHYGANQKQDQKDYVSGKGTCKNRERPNNRIGKQK